MLRGNHEAEGKLRKLDLEGRQATTSINSFELFYGAYRSRDRGGNVLSVKNLLERLDVLPFESESSARAGETLAALAARGEVVDFRDAMIAAVARLRGLPLVSRNKEHFSRFEDLKLEPW